MRYLPKAMSLVIFLSLSASPAPADVQDQLTIDGMIEQVVQKRKAAADAAKAQTTAEAELKAAVEALNKRLADLGLSGPVPNPGPVVPPVPAPPSDPLARRLWDAYRADTSVTKSEAIKDMIELMKQAQTLADDAKLTTVDQLAKKVSAAAATLAKDQLPGVRAVIRAELATAFTDAEAALTTEIRSVAKLTFVRLQTALIEASK